jgi:hypothetical protein
MDIEKAKIHLADQLTGDGGLYDVARYLHYDAGSGQAALDGSFTADDLEAIAAIMRASEAT